MAFLWKKEFRAFGWVGEKAWNELVLDRRLRWIEGFSFCDCSAVSGEHFDGFVEWETFLWRLIMKTVYERDRNELGRSVWLCERWMNRYKRTQLSRKKLIMDSTCETTTHAPYNFSRTTFFCGEKKIKFQIWFGVSLNLRWRQGFQKCE